MEHDHMLEECPPSYAQSHDPESINLPSVPTADPPPIHHERVLPPPSAVSADPRYRQETAAEAQFSWPSSNPLTAYYQPGPAQLSPKTTTTRSTDSPSGMDLDISESRARRGGSVVSIDDPDVRIAAEALGDLRADFIQSPPHHYAPNSSNSPRFQQRNSAQPEPLLSLFTTSHPLISTAIGGSLSAYSASKNYSPRFKSSAEYVERRFTPVLNTVGSVGRITGVEGGVRWFLGGRRPSHHGPSENDSDSPSHKRRKVNTSSPSDIENQTTQYDNQYYPPHQRRPSQASTSDSLPAYDDYRSPSYEASQALIPTNQRSEDSASPGSSWQSRLVLSTSGLSVAMSEESLRSLKYCLSWLRWANEHIGKVIAALKSVLEQYDHSGTITDKPHSEESRENQKQMVLHTDEERSALHAKIAELKKDVLKTLKEVVDIVSKYAGGALPENARDLVRKHLTSLPQRFRIASSISFSAGGTAQNGEGDDDNEVKEGAKRVMVLAKEGLDMMAQVSGVLDGTIVSAEEWCEKLGRKKREEREQATEEKRDHDEKVGMGMGNAERYAGEEDKRPQLVMPTVNGDTKIAYPGFGSEATPTVA
ncbi:clock controlled protein [Rutstroemia sp. NJR-2017a BBW]|nr:clock controlled protein [Rutstroemia sp. NJR-2017a BBW]